MLTPVGGNRFAVDGVGPVVFPYPCMYPEQYDYITALKHAILDSSKVCNHCHSPFIPSNHLSRTFLTHPYPGTSV